MNKTKIDYAEYSWNPVFGCLTRCEYCYAAAYAKRFKKDFRPHWVEENFQRSMPKNPSIIFVNSMSDIYWWKTEWTAKVLDRSDDNSEHIFLFLTKKPEVYSHSFWKYQPDNCWYGFTATNDEEVKERQSHMYGFERVWCSAEPLLGSVENVDVKIVKWLVVGAMTGAGATPIKQEWLSKLRDYEGALFFKRNLKSDFIRIMWREYPQEMLEHLGRCDDS